jgi:hypothetical protein
MYIITEPIYNVYFQIRSSDLNKRHFWSKIGDTAPLSTAGIEGALE